MCVVQTNRWFLFHPFHYNLRHSLIISLIFLEYSEWRKRVFRFSFSLPVKTISFHVHSLFWDDVSDLKRSYTISRHLNGSWIRAHVFFVSLLLKYEFWMTWKIWHEFVTFVLRNCHAQHKITQPGSSAKGIEISCNQHLGKKYDFSSFATAINNRIQK